MIKQSPNLNWIALRTELTSRRREKTVDKDNSHSSRETRKLTPHRQIPTQNKSGLRWRRETTRFSEGQVRTLTPGPRQFLHKANESHRTSISRGTINLHQLSLKEKIQSTTTIKLLRKTVIATQITVKSRKHHFPAKICISPLSTSSTKHPRSKASTIQMHYSMEMTSAWRSCSGTSRRVQAKCKATASHTIQMLKRLPRYQTIREAGTISFLIHSRWQANSYIMPLKMKNISRQLSPLNYRAVLWETSSNHMSPTWLRRVTPSSTSALPWDVCKLNLHKLITRSMPTAKEAPWAKTREWSSI